MTVLDGVRLQDLSIVDTSSSCARLALDGLLHVLHAFLFVSLPYSHLFQKVERSLCPPPRTVDLTRMLILAPNAKQASCEWSYPCVPFRWPTRSACTLSPIPPSLPISSSSLSTLSCLLSIVWQSLPPRSFGFASTLQLFSSTPYCRSSTIDVHFLHPFLHCFSLCILHHHHSPLIMFPWCHLSDPLRPVILPQGMFNFSILFYILSYHAFSTITTLPLLPCFHPSPPLRPVIHPQDIVSFVLVKMEVAWNWMLPTLP